LKDSCGNTVFLRGVNKAEFTDNPGGAWFGQGISDLATWNSKLTQIGQELDEMKSRGINVIRCHQAIEHWTLNMGQHRDIIKSLLNLCAERGIYVIYDGYCVRNYWHGGKQDPLPYPPFSNSPDAATIIPDEPAFVAYWQSIASELKGFDNVLFEIWNEPHSESGYPVQPTDYFTTAQHCIDAIRNVGAQQIIIIQWGYGCWVNLDYPPPNNPAGTMDWITQYPLTGSNLMYSTHVYRAIGYGGYGTPRRAVNYNETRLVFTYEKIPWVTETLNKPLFLGEFAYDMAATVPAEEMACFQATLDLCEEWGISYTPFWWRNIAQWRLITTSVPPFTPSTGGIALKAELLSLSINNTAPPVNPNGILKVSAKLNGSDLALTAQANGQNYTTPFSISLTNGTYTVATSYNGKAYPQTAVIVSGQTTEVTFDLENPVQPTQPVTPTPPSQTQPSNFLEGLWQAITGFFRWLFGG
jgi:hypothetical protein